MSITARILVGFIILATAGVFLFLGFVTKRIEQAYQEAVEEPMVDTAETFAAVISKEIEANGKLDEAWASGLKAANQRTIHAQIYNRLKTHVSLDLYITNKDGNVVFDSGHPENVGRNFKAFRDVALTLQGEYGARTSRQDSGDKPATWIFYVAAPIIYHGHINGVVSVYKAQSDIAEFFADTERTLALLGLGVIIVSTGVGAALSRWVTAPLARVTKHALAIAAGERPAPPQLPGRHLRILGESLERMRDALEGREYVQSFVQALSHEMKAPVAAISGAAELLFEDIPAEQRTRFLSNIRAESARLERLIEELLALSVIENRKRLEAPQRIDITALVDRVITETHARTSAVSIEFRPAQAAFVRGDEFMLQHAIANLIQNAVEFSPAGGEISVSVEKAGRSVTVRVRDQGPGVPDYALNKVFDRFYSLPRPSTGKKSSGLGLCLVREVGHLHNGRVTLTNRRDRSGAEAELVLEAAE